MILRMLCVFGLLGGSLFLSRPSVAQEKPDAAWTDLFYGKDFAGWKRDPLGKSEYAVVDGTIHGKTVEGSPNSFLYTEKEYGDFELEFEVKVHDQLNSGVQIRSREKSLADVDAEVAKGGKVAKNKNASIGRFFGPQVEIEASPGKAGYIYGEATGYGWLSAEPQDPKHSPFGDEERRVEQVSRVGEGTEDSNVDQW